MGNNIHPTAIIEDGAIFGNDIEIGAYAYIGGQVTIGNGTKVHHHATIEGWTEIGERNEIFPYSLIGGKTHDLKFSGGTPGLKIGNDNVFREYVSIHVGTNDKEFTIIGNNNSILAYSHVAHDCIIGDHLVMSSHSALGGHVIVSNHVNVAWGSGIHQFCSIGAYSMVSACAKVVQDVPPFMIADGNPAEVKTINKVGLQRNGFNTEELDMTKAVFKTLYKKGYNRSQALEQLKELPNQDSRILKEIYNFAEQSNRGFA